MTGREIANQLTSDLLVEIPKRFPGCRVWRANVAAVRTANGGFMRAGVPGQCDISGISGKLAGGRRVEVEVKSGKDRMSVVQLAWRQMILDSGGIHVVARELEPALNDLRWQMGGGTAASSL